MKVRIPAPHAGAALLVGTLTLLSAVAPVTAQDADAEIARIMADPAVRSAIEHIAATDEQTMSDLVTLTEIPAPPFTETVRGQAFLEMMVELGVDSAWVDDEGNVLGLRRGSGDGEVLALTAHLDTVFPEGTDVSVRMRGDTLYAPGIADDTRGLATLLAILRSLNATDIRTNADILFVGTVGEEGLGDLRGVKHLFREGGPRIDTFISIDGTGASGVTHMGLGSHRYRITFRGPGGHSWGAFGLANPAHAMGRAILHFENGANEYVRAAPYRTSYNVGRMGGGTSVNSVPFEAWMEIDMRSEGNTTLQEVDDILQEAIQLALAEENEIRQRGDALTVDVELIGNRPSGEIDESHPFVQKAVAATRAFGFEPRLGRSSTDSNISISMGIPSMTIGGGGEGFDAHSLHEGFLNADGHVGVQRALVIVLSQVGIARAS